MYEHGWKMEGDKIQILWDEDEMIARVTARKGCGCKAQKCDGSTAGCRSCYRMCQACTIKCKCKMLCNNPHNNARTCPKCAVEQEGELDRSDDENTGNDGSPDDDNGDAIPIVPPSQHDEVDTDSEVSDSDSEN